MKIGGLKKQQIREMREWGNLIAVIGLQKPIGFRFRPSDRHWLRSDLPVNPHENEVVVWRMRAPSELAKEAVARGPVLVNVHVGLPSGVCEQGQVLGNDGEK